MKRYGRLPLSFEANQGQCDPRVKFLSRGRGYNLFLAADEAVLALKPLAANAQHPVGGIGLSVSQKPSATNHQASGGAVLRMRLLNTNAKPVVSGQDELPGKSNYFIGNDPKKWQTNVLQYAKVRYENVYPGVNLMYYGHQSELEYDFVLQPGANPHSIRLVIEGAKSIRLEHGALLVVSEAGDLHLRAPRIYQDVGGTRRKVSGGYVLRGANEVQFEVSGYDSRRALVIDPVLAYSTYLGGSAFEQGRGIAVDSEGNAYITGDTDSTDFPTVNAIQPSGGNYSYAFVTKLNHDGTALIYSTYLGGQLNDRGNSIALDSAGNAYVTGYTFSTDFPVANAIQPTLHGKQNAFVTEINADGNALAYSTYLGGSSYDTGFGIALDSAGNAYVTGSTYSTDFPIVKPIQSTNHGGSDAFVTKFIAGGSALAYSTYLGGSADDFGYGITVDSAGKAYIIGTTSSTDLPTKNAFQPHYGGGVSDTFVTKINALSGALVYSTYLGGNSYESGYAIAADSAGNAYLTGQTESPDFPTVNAFQPAIKGTADAFVTKINAGGSALVYSTFLGGGSGDLGSRIAVDAMGDAYVSGGTSSSDFPTVDAIQSTNRSKVAGNGFVTKMNPNGSALLYSTYLGGSGADGDYGSLAIDAAGNAYVTGMAGSTDFPTTPVAFQLSRNGGWDFFVAKIAAQTFVSLSKLTLSFPTQPLGTTSATKTVTVTNQGSGNLPINSIFGGGLDPSDFAEANTCDSSLAPGASCTISVTFAPKAKGTRKAGVGISSSDPASPDAIRLSGTGTVVSLSATNLAFGKNPVGTASPPQNVTLTNLGSTWLNFNTFNSISIIGTNAGDFSETNNCGTSILPHANCTISVTFKPTATGTRRAAAIIRDDGGGSPQRIPLVGTGT
jgi:archaellum component FlaF (FlaF/FlaG flagellin family)